VKPEEVYMAWAPAGSIWSPWAIPVPFAQIGCVPTDADGEIEGVKGLAEGLAIAADLAVVIDLPGDQGVRLCLALASRGFRPVPLIDGSPGPDVLGTFQGLLLAGQTAIARSGVAVDMRLLMRWLCIGAEVLPTLPIAAKAPPVFLLDSMRTGTANFDGANAFDNRWKTFPQDFPSAGFLKEQGIKRVVLIKENPGQPLEDLAHVLLRWQEGGISILAASAADATSAHPIRINRPSLFRSLWYRALTIIGLRRATGGGFGAWPHGSGGG